MASNSNYQSFWDKVGPGLFDVGVGAFTKNQAQHEASDRLGAAQGPLYQQSMAAAQQQLGMLGNFDPQAFAKQRFDEQQALLDPVYDKQLDDLSRRMFVKGQQGVANYNPGVEGITPNGTAMNPQLAAFFAAKNAQRSKDAYGAMDQGQKYIDSLINRSGMLQQQAGRVQGAGLEAQRTQPSRAAANGEILRGVSGVLKDAGIYKDAIRGIPGAVRSTTDALGITQAGGPGLVRTATDAVGLTQRAPAPAPAPTGGVGGGAGSPPPGYDLGSGMSVDSTGAVTGGTPYTYDDGQGGTAALMDADIGAFDPGSAFAGMVDLGGGLGVDEYGEIVGGTDYEYSPLAWAAPGATDLFDLGSGMGVDEFGNVMAMPDFSQFAFDPSAFDLSQFDLSGLGDFGFDFSWI